MDPGELMMRELLALTTQGEKGDGAQKLNFSNSSEAELVNGKSL